MTSPIYTIPLDAMRIILTLFQHFTAAALLKGQTLPAGGGSPSLRTDRQRITGAISTVRGNHYYPSFPGSSRGLEMTGSSGPAGVDSPSSGRRTKMAHLFGRCCKFRFKVLMRRRCILPVTTLPAGGGSPSLRTDRQRITGAISTVRDNARGVALPGSNRRFEGRHPWRPAGVDCPSSKFERRLTAGCHVGASSNFFYFNPEAMAC